MNTDVSSSGAGVLRVTDPRSMAALDLELAELEARKAKLERLAALRVEVAAAEGRELAARFGRDQDWERFKTILLVVSGAYNVPMMQLTGVTRVDWVVQPRMIAFYLARRLTKLSLNEIGRAVGNRDHGTVLHGVRRVRDRLEVERGFADELAAVEEKCGRTWLTLTTDAEKQKLQAIQ